MKGESAGRILIAACAVTIVGALAGAGLGSFAAGGVPLRIAERDDGDQPLGRPEAMIADRAETAYTGPPPIIPTVCEGCGPSLQERKAMARDRAIEAEMARNEALLRRGYAEDARFDAEMAAPAIERAGDPAAVSAPIAFRLTGASATLAEAADAPR
ncbi:hypothetical protein [Sphingomonas colocasiae]|uniref:Uncharacterized protein n=1 Tax=Sphingomonas colocasiae TaxID=1848973 RepID=A0ABS7PM51_9SPHN|nr:hypothetical protein [Sphingomonas colocasiae]MBY8822328.1 hypothetical protein [Sphingomonas colocasiae]